MGSQEIFRDPFLLSGHKLDILSYYVIILVYKIAKFSPESQQPPGCFLVYPRPESYHASWSLFLMPLSAVALTRRCRSANPLTARAMCRGASDGSSPRTGAAPSARRRWRPPRCCRPSSARRWCPPRRARSGFGSSPRAADRQCPRGSGSSPCPPTASAASRRSAPCRAGGSVAALTASAASGRWRSSMRRTAARRAASCPRSRLVTASPPAL